MPEVMEQIDEAQTTLDQFITDNRLVMETEKTFHNPNMNTKGSEMTHWIVKIHIKWNRHASMSLTFSQGLAHTEPPKLADVLDCIASDASCIENAATFEDFAGDLGYDEDSREAERTYNACKAQTEQLVELLDHEAYSTLLWDTERL